MLVCEVAERVASLYLTYDQSQHCQKLLILFMTEGSIFYLVWIPYLKILKLFRHTVVPQYLMLLIETSGRFMPTSNILIMLNQLNRCFSEVCILPKTSENSF